MTATATGPAVIHIQQRDTVGLVLCGEHGGAPYDLLAAALGVPRAPARDHRPVAAGRVRSHRAARPRPGVVLADRERHGRYRPCLPARAAQPRPRHARPRGPRRPARTASRPGLAATPALVAIGTPYPP